MKRLLFIPLVLFALYSLGAPPILRQFATTNTPTDLTNIIQSLGPSLTGDNTFTGSNYFSLLSTAELLVDSGGGIGYVTLENDGTNIIILNGTNGTITAPQFSGTVLYTGASTFPSATNTLTLNNDYAFLVVSTDSAITNVLGQSSGQYKWASLWLSNSAASAITARWLTPGRAIGTATTNALIVGSGKVGLFSVICRGTLGTNYATSVEQ